MEKNIIMNKIIGVAIKHDGEIHRMPKPFRHYDLIREISKNTNNFPIRGNEYQGFYTDDQETYLDRKQSMELAIINKQVKEGDTINSKHLFSEDLW